MTSLDTVNSYFRPCIQRGVAAVNGKGGTLKTSTLANQAALLALAGFRVLAIDLDPQGDGNLGTDLGYNARTEEMGYSKEQRTDRGRSLAMALSYDEPVRVLYGVRENLDVICGGAELEKAVPTLSSMDSKQYRYQLLKILDELAQRDGTQYDMVLVDTPPGNRILQEIALTTVQYCYIPTRTDSASIIEGVGHIANTFATIKYEANLDLTLLGVVICGTTYKGATLVRQKDGTTKQKAPTKRFKDVRQQIAGILGDAAPVYENYVRYVEAAAVDSRDGGQLAHELEEYVITGPSLYQQLKNPELRVASPSSASGLASDYQGITSETLAYISNHEANLAGARA